MHDHRVEKSPRFPLSDQPASITVGGILYQRVDDQADAQRTARLEQIGERLADLAGAHRAEADRLIGESESIWGERLYAVVRAQLRQVHDRLIEARVDPRVWLAIYLDTLAGESAYRPGDELHAFDNVQPGDGSGC